MLLPGPCVPNFTQSLFISLVDGNAWTSSRSRSGPGSTYGPCLRAVCVQSVMIMCESAEGACSSVSRLFSSIMLHLVCLVGVIRLFLESVQKAALLTDDVLTPLATPASLTSSLNSEKQTKWSRKNQHGTVLSTVLYPQCNKTNTSHNAIYLLSSWT